MTNPVPLMRGATHVRDVVISYLENTLPSLLQTARNDWGLTANFLPDPFEYSRTEAFEMGNDSPIISCNVANMDGLYRQEIDPDNALIKYSMKYSVQLFLWIRTPVDEVGQNITGTTDSKYDSTVQLRDDYAALIRNALLLSPSLGSPDALMDESTLTENYSDTTGQGNGSWISSVRFNFDLKLDEVLRTGILGEADTVSITSVHLLSKTSSTSI